MRQLASKTDELLSFLKAVSDKKRLTIIKLLKRGELCVCEIYPALNIAQNLASHHLSVLKDNGLISSKKDGKKVYYRLNHEILERKIDLLNKHLS